MLLFLNLKPSGGNTWTADKNREQIIEIAKRSKAAGEHGKRTG